jgi:hypothetical protein
MQSPHLHPKRATCAQRQPRKEPRHVVFVQPIQRSAQAVVVEVVGQDARSEQVRDRFVGEELRDQIQPPVTASQPVEHQRDRRSPHADVSPALGIRRLEPLGHPDLTTDFRHNAQMGEMLDDRAWRHRSRTLSNSVRPGPAPADTPVRTVVFTLPKIPGVGQSKTAERELYFEGRVILLWRPPPPWGGYVVQVPGLAPARSGSPGQMGRGGSLPRRRPLAGRKPRTRSAGAGTAHYVMSSSPFP